MTAPFVGRDHELGVLRSALDRAGRGERQIVLVDADPGFGKSALLTAFTAAHPDMRVLAWTGDETETALPFGMLAYLLETTPDWADPYVAGAAALHRLGDLVSGSPDAAPLLLALDDLQLADPASLTAVNFLLRRLRRDPVLTVATCRTGQVPGLPTSLVRMAADGGTRITLAGLDAAEIQALASAWGHGRLSGRAAGRLQAHTRGNPLHLRALFAEVPVADLEELDRPIPAPASFAQLVLAELATASPRARRVAMAAAVLGASSAVEHLARVVDLDPAAVLTAVEELDFLRILHVDPGTTIARFHHPLVQAAVYVDLGPATRVELHLRAAQLGPSHSALRHRVAAATGPDENLAADVAAEAERARDRGDLHAAARLMTTAHRLSPPGQAADQRLLAGVDLLLAAGDATAAQRYVDRLAALPASGRRLATQARLAWLTGHLDEAVRLGEQAWNKADDLTADQRHLLATTLAQIEIQRDRAAQAIRWADCALADGALDARTASRTRSERALALATSGDLDAGLAALAWLPADPRQVPLENHAELVMRGHLRTWEGHSAAAATDLAVGAWGPEHRDSEPFRITGAGSLADCLFRSGDWPRSQAVAEQVCSLAEDMDQTWVLGYLHAIAALVPSATGDWSTAQRHVDSALEAEAMLGDPATAVTVGTAVAFLAVSRGRPNEVVRATERFTELRMGSPGRELGMFTWPTLRVAALIELGRLDEADAELALIRDRLRPGDDRARVTVARVTGELAAARRDLDAARAAFTDALTDPHHRGDVLERALAHAAYGRFLRRRGERRAAVDQLQQARQRFEALGARPFLGACLDELAACGAETTPLTECPRVLSDLTTQERVVAALVCAGRTNREAAAELVLSVKTIGYHLGNVYAKLGVHNRAQLVAALRDSGLVKPPER